MNPTWPQIADKALDKIPVDKVYEDLLQPSFKKAGEALSTIVDLSNTVLFPIAWLNGIRAERLKFNLLKYQNKLNATDEPVIQVPDEISIPVIERLAITTQEELADAFVNLLTKASFASTIQQIHPSYTTLLGSLCADEARILAKYEPYAVFHSISAITDVKVNGRETQWIGNHLTLIGENVNLEFPQNVGMYTANLIRLGIFQADYASTKLNVESMYEKLEAIYLESLRETGAEQVGDAQFMHGIVQHTEFGDHFVKCCLMDMPKP